MGCEGGDRTPRFLQTLHWLHVIPESATRGTNGRLSVGHSGTPHCAIIGHPAVLRCSQSGTSHCALAGHPAVLSFAVHLAFPYTPGPP
jgi:hypothetical protein